MVAAIEAEASAEPRRLLAALVDLIQPHYPGGTPEADALQAARRYLAGND